MGNDFTSGLRPALVFAGLFAILLGIGYPLAMTGLAQAIFPSQANGSLVRQDGKVIGSSVLGQAFTTERYFHTRPSAAGQGYDALASAGSNLGPTSGVLVDRVKRDVAARRAEGVTGAVPADLVTASASGLDPHLSPAAALAQAPRIARVRGIGEAAVRDLVDCHVRAPTLGILGEAHVDVLALNRDLDRLGAASAAR
jgi:K+-transporting ATPase ATPase C chain